MLGVVGVFLVLVWGVCVGCFVFVWLFFGVVGLVFFIVCGGCGWGGWVVGFCGCWVLGAGLGGADGGLGRVWFDPGVGVGGWFVWREVFVWCGVGWGCDVVEVLCLRRCAVGVAAQIK
ncbi:hypothetical protein RA276_28005, partial [Pseudomonas syringae pv. tagetis]